MGRILNALIMLLVINVFILSIGTGIGFLLRWILPGVDLGTGTLIGVVSLSISIYFFVRVTTTNIGPEEVDMDEEDYSQVKHALEQMRKKPRRRRTYR